MAEPTSTIPVGFCQCGCGGRTSIAKRNRPEKGWIKGQPKRFINRHHYKLTARRFSPSTDQYTVQDCGYKTPCWIWKGRACRGQGYASAKHRRAHVIYYELRFGPVPPGLELDHLCEQKRCVNPDHLEPVTHAENVRRGRHTKLTIEKAREIRRLAASGIMTFEQIGQQFGCLAATVSMIHRNVQWREDAA